MKILKFEVDKKALIVLASLIIILAIGLVGASKGHAPYLPPRVPMHPAPLPVRAPSPTPSL